MSKRKSLEYCFSSIVFQLILPLVPLICFFILEIAIDKKSLLLILSMYAFSLGVSSRYVSILTAGIFFGLLFAYISSFIPSQQFIKINQILDDKNSIMAVSCIGILFLSSILERFTIHVIDRKPFFRFF